MRSSIRSTNDVPPSQNQCAPFDCLHCRLKVLSKLGIVLHLNHLIINIQVRVIGKLASDKELCRIMRREREESTSDF